MPSNLYGVANAGILAGVSAQGQVTCPAGVETPVIGTAPLIAPSQGFYYPAIFWFVDITLGASLPTQLRFAFRIGTGSDLDVMQYDLAALVASTTINFTAVMFGNPSSVPWQAPGSVLQATINPQTNGVTANSAAGRAWFALFRAPDQ